MKNEKHDPSIAPFRLFVDTEKGRTCETLLQNAIGDESRRRSVLAGLLGWRSDDCAFQACKGQWTLLRF